MSTFAKFPFYGEPWLDCPICGNSFPRHEMQRHYKKGFLVDKLCADSRAHDDYMAELIRGRERPDPSEQVVKNQGKNSALSPSAVPGPSADALFGIAKISGNNSAGFLTVTTGPTLSPGNIIATVTFGTAFASNPIVVITPWDPNAQVLGIEPFPPLPHKGVYVVVIGPSSFRISAGVGTLLQTGVTYQWTYSAHL